MIPSIATDIKKKNWFNFNFDQSKITFGAHKILRPKPQLDHLRWALSLNLVAKFKSSFKYLVQNYENEHATRKFESSLELGVASDCKESKKYKLPFCYTTLRMDTI